MFDGVKSTHPLLPILDQHKVVDQITRAVRANQEELFIPPIVSLSFIMRFFVASEWRDPLSKLFGLHKNMDDFQGLRRIK